MDTQLVQPLAEMLAIAAPVIGGALYVQNHAQARADKWRETYELNHPSDMSKDMLLEFVHSLSSLPKSRLLHPIYPVAFERYATQTGSRWFLRTPGGSDESVDKLFGTHIRGSMTPVTADEDVVANTEWDEGREYNTSKGALSRPLNIRTVEGTAATIGTAFQDIPPGEIRVMQWLVYPDTAQHRTPENKEKMAERTFHVLLRLGVKGGHEHSLDAMFLPFRSVDSDSAVIKRRLIPNVPTRLRQRSGTWPDMGYLNALELSAVFGWPLDGSGPRMARRMAPTVSHDEPGPGMITFGPSNFPRMRHKQIAMPIYGEQNRSLHILGESGSGKSVMLENLAVQIAAKPDIAFMAMEPSGDLVEHILKCIPDSRWKDVIYFNPLDTDYPIGLNPLKGSDPEQVASHIVSMFNVRYKDTFSASMQRVMTTAVTTAALLQGTLYDAMLMLTSEDYRSTQLSKLRRDKYPDLFESWDSITRRGDIASDSTVNRFHALMGFSAVRNILSQPDGLDFDWILREHKILLMPLPGARMGPTNAAVIGSLATEMMLSAARRQPPPASSRNKVTIMRDEAQNYLSESEALSDTDSFAEDRKNGVQHILANQFNEQLGKMQQTIGQNVPSKVMFRSSPEEAHKMAKYFSPFSEEDLANLAKYDAVIRLNSSGGMAPPVTIHTPPPPQMTGNWSNIIENTRRTYSPMPTAEQRKQGLNTPRAVVEAAIAARHKRPQRVPLPTFGDM